MTPRRRKSQWKCMLTRANAVYAKASAVNLRVSPYITGSVFGAGDRGFLSLAPALREGDGLKFSSASASLMAKSLRGGDCLCGCACIFKMAGGTTATGGGKYGYGDAVAVVVSSAFSHSCCTAFFITRGRTTTKGKKKINECFKA